MGRSMAAGQQWLFAPAKPLVERLGRKFFRKVPARPGVYLMRDASGDVVYVGKAKNLRQRLRSYRVANPERMPRRHLRMVREIARRAACAVVAFRLPVCDAIGSAS